MRTPFSDTSFQRYDMYTISALYLVSMTWISFQSLYSLAQFIISFSSTCTVEQWRNILCTQQRVPGVVMLGPWLALEQGLGVRANARARARKERVVIVMKVAHPP